MSMVGAKPKSLMEEAEEAERAEADQAEEDERLAVLTGWNDSYNFPSRHRFDAICADRDRDRAIRNSRNPDQEQKQKARKIPVKR